MSQPVTIVTTPPGGLAGSADLLVQDDEPIQILSDVTYTVKIGDRLGNPIEEVPAKNLLMSFLLDAPGSVSFTLPQRHPKTTKALIAPGQRSILVERSSGGSTQLVWAGPLWTAAMNNGQVQIGGEGWFSIFSRRHIGADLTYTATDQLDIAWNLINFTQIKDFGDLGITRASLTGSGVLRDQSYNGVERTILADALKSLASLDNGFDFEITPDRRWATYYPFKGTNSGVIFELGKNISGLSWTLDATSVFTEMTAIGSGSGDTTLISVRSDPVGLQTYGLLQSSNAYVDVSKQPTLDAHALEDVNIVKVIRDDPQIQAITTQVEPPFGSYSVGDNVRVVAEDGFVDIDRFYRVKTITVAISDAGVENIGLFFDEVVG